MRTSFTEKNGAIPPDFGKDKNSVFLVVNSSRWIKKGVENYKGKYELISPLDLLSGEFDDKVKYRFVFHYSLGKAYSTQTTTRSSGAQNIRISNGNFKRYYVEDRLEEKVYECGEEFNHFGKAIAIYMENLDKKRRKER